MVLAVKRFLALVVMAAFLGAAGLGCSGDTTTKSTVKSTTTAPTGATTKTEEKTK